MKGYLDQKTTKKVIELILKFLTLIENIVENIIRQIDMVSNTGGPNFIKICTILNECFRPSLRPRFPQWLINLGPVLLVHQ